MRLALLIAAILTFGASAATAQSWFTQDACALDGARVDDWKLSTVEEIRRDARLARIENGVGRLWRVTSQAGRVSHLWGTLHSNDPAVLDLPTRLREILGAAKVVAVEIDQTKASRAELTEYAKREGIYLAVAGQQFLELDLRVLEWAGKRLQSNGYQQDAIEWIAPWALAETLLWHPCDDFRAWVYPIQDARIQLLGEEAGADIVGLEHPDRLRIKLKGPGGTEIALGMIERYGANLGPDTLDGYDQSQVPVISEARSRA